MDEMTDKQFEALINLIIAIVKTSENADEAIAKNQRSRKKRIKKEPPAQSGVLNSGAGLSPLHRP